ncbi:MAG: biopolymer transporter ExbD [Bacteroidia bacterium]|nr:biopolymer transporter ExbD [Bacteroidia bacterium]
MALRRARRESEVSTDSLSDIMFFLLLFFLILSTMVSPNAIKVNLPDANPKPLVQTGEPIHLTMTDARKYFVNQKETDLNGIENLLKAEIQKATLAKKEPAIIIHVDRTLQYQDFIDVLEIGNKLNVKMVCATKSSNG